jgi:hypothetical protein
MSKTKSNSKCTDIPVTTETESLSRSRVFLEKVVGDRTGLRVYPFIKNYCCMHTVRISSEFYTLRRVTTTIWPCSTSIHLHFLHDPYRTVAVSIDESDNEGLQKAAQKLTSFLDNGLCADCGSIQHPNQQCQNATAELLNPQDGNDRTCTICQEPCQNMVRMPCGHGFHWMCLSKLYAHSFIAPCPVCRKRCKRDTWDFHFYIGNDHENDSDADEEEEE